jgi:hypothetical protein
MAISSVNDAATATQPLELKVSTLYINGSAGAFTFTAGLQVGAATGGDKGYGTINANGAYYANGTAGVGCSGAPSASFASVNGIVTHC